MDILIALDAWLILKACEPFAWRVEYHYPNWNCFSISRGALTLGILAFNAGWALGSPHTLILFGPITGFMWVSSMNGNVRLEHSVVIRPNSMNPLKRFWPIRMGMPLFGLMLGISIGMRDGSFVLIGNIAGWLLLVVSTYFLSCNPMPPSWTPPQREEKFAGVPAHG